MLISAELILGNTCVGIGRRSGLWSYIAAGIVGAQPRCTASQQQEKHCGVNKYLPSSSCSLYIATSHSCWLVLCSGIQAGLEHPWPRSGTWLPCRQRLNFNKG